MCVVDFMLHFFCLFWVLYPGRVQCSRGKTNNQIGLFVTKHNNYILLSHHKQINDAPPLNFNEVKVSVKYEMRCKVFLEAGVMSGGIGNDLMRICRVFGGRDGSFIKEPSQGGRAQVLNNIFLLKKNSLLVTQSRGCLKTAIIFPYYKLFFHNLLNGSQS